ncbi:flavin reductase family protein [Pseudomonas sp. GD04087]|uniref:flavin reductase family protein n=1 Tax=unclassified Pseudomonas TaxID=196821 RepID=UPI00244CD6A2|nr:MULTISPECIES: flavin reductase family protein [unclassified Pseudomonas]MDH0292452.1 flavin reductase family protein [Pseudomonas sp. GD04087]MDH1049426.1 flavin reductase family protein [Pseudomonas sp. GD03903]MDH2002569.1 flavin reductase family protein [Pseudomonas sp. GD03691]
MQLDFTQLSKAEAYRWLASTVTPRPIAWVSTLSADGQSNLAPFSFFQVISDSPPTLLVNTSVRDDGSVKDTLRNVRETGELVIHLVSAAQAEQMNATAAWLPHGVSEIEHAGIASVPSERVAPPRVAGAPVAFECQLAEILPYPAENPSSMLIFARVLLAHIDESVMHDERHVDPVKLDLVGRLGGTQYSYTRDTFSMIRPR